MTISLGSKKHNLNLKNIVGRRLPPFILFFEREPSEDGIEGGSTG